MKIRLMYPALIIAILLLISFNEATASRLNQEDGIMPNHSAEYVRTLNRNASTDADAAFYNPAGLAFMENNGLYIMFSSQTYRAVRVHSMDYYGIMVQGSPMIPTLSSGPFFGGIPEEYKAETVAPVLPDLDLIYKQDNWAVYFDISVMQAAPGMTFNEGLAVMDWGNLAQLETLYAMGAIDSYYAFWRDAKAVRTEYYFGGTVGGVYKILNWFSAALGLRLIYATGNQSIEVKNAGFMQEIGGVTQPISLSRLGNWLINTDVSGYGLGVIVGFHFRPIEIIDIGLRYEYYAPMVLKKVTNDFYAPGNIVSSGNMNIFVDSWKKMPWYDSAFNPSKMLPDTIKNVGKELKVTYPQTISLGFSVKIIKNLRAETSGEISLRPFRDLDGREDNWNIGFKVGQCIEWTFLPRMTISLGYVYNDFGIKSAKRDEADPLLTSHSLGGGFTFNVTDRLNLTVGGFYMIFVPEKVYYVEYTNISTPTIHALSKEFDEERMSIAIGATYRFLGESSGGSNGMSLKLR